MKQIALQDFRQDLDSIVDKTTFQPLAIMLPDGRRLILMSEEVYLSGRRAPRQALRATDLTEEEIEEIANTKIPEETGHLDEELEK